VTCAVQSH
jgi:hypothetical protein